METMCLVKIPIVNSKGESTIELIKSYHDHVRLNVTAVYTLNKLKLLQKQ